MPDAFLEVIGGKHAGKRIPLPVGRFLIGRGEDCHLRPNSELVSRHHCVFTVDAYAVRLRDLGSTNGTYLNDERMEGQVLLSRNDRVRIGKLEFRIELIESDDDGFELQHDLVAVTPLAVAGGHNLPDYLSPEQIDERPDRPTTPATDVHAAGVIAFELLVGELPLPEGNMQRVLAIGDRRFTSAVERCRELGLPGRMAPVLDRCLAGDFQTTGAFRDALLEAVPVEVAAIGTGHSSRPDPEDRFRVVRGLFEDAVTQAFEVTGTVSAGRFTLRMFKPGFQGNEFRELAADLVAQDARYPDDVPEVIVRRYASGDARPIPIDVGIEVEIGDRLPDGGSLSLLEEFAGDRTLMDLVRSQEAVGDEERVVRLVVRMLDGLRYAHRSDCVHAQLTPFCVFLGEADDVRIEGLGMHARVERVRVAGGGDASSLSTFTAAADTWVESFVDDGKPPSPPGSNSKEPGKLPEKPPSSDSRESAAETLRRFFNNRRPDN